MSKLKSRRQCIFMMAGILMLVLAAGCLVTGTKARAASGVPKAPVFSKESGFYEKGFSLKITAKGEKTTIYYTTDGSEPTKQSTKYTRMISVSDRSSEPNILSAIDDTSVQDHFIPETLVEKGTVIRAVAVNASGKKSEIVTKSYFIGKELAKKYEDIPVVSLVMPKESLFDYKVGIYTAGWQYDAWLYSLGDPKTTGVWLIPANYTQTGKEWERAVHMDLFESSKEGIGVSQDLGVRICGAASTHNLQKSFKLFARSEYGKKKVKYDLIPGNKSERTGNEVKKYDTFILRNGGNDTNIAKFRDSYLQSLVSDRDFTTQASCPAIVFLNGEYWGIYTLQEDYNEDYLEQNYDIDEENCIISKKGLIDTGTYQDQKIYDEMIYSMYDTDYSAKAGYKKICSMVDIQSLIDYYCAELFINNHDWVAWDNNYEMWRSRTVTDNPYEDGKWRYMMYDTEYSCGLYEQCKTYETDSLTEATTITEIPSEQIKLFSSLLRNETFKKQFVSTFMDMLNTNFLPERTISRLDRVSAEYRPFMSDYFNRFGPQYILEKYLNTTDYFDETVSQLRTYMLKRYEYIPKMLKKDLELQGNVAELTVNVSKAAGGTVQVNSVNPDFLNGSWTGKYFTDYPVTLTAKAAKGYTFTGWTGLKSSKNNKITVTLSEAGKITANFK